MKKTDKRQLDNNFIERKIAKAFGYADEQLAEELDRFAAEAEKSDNRALEAPEGEFDRIWDRVEGESGRRRKGSRVRGFVRVMAVAAILGTMVLGGGMWAGAKRYYVEEVRERRDLENVISINNSPDNVDSNKDYEVNKAYDQIKDGLNIEVLELSYLPDDIKFNTLIMERTKGKMIFLDDVNTPLYFYQGTNDKPSSLSYASDMKKYSSVYNMFIDEEIPIYTNDLENGKMEFSVRIIRGHQYYILQGSIDSDKFVQIVEGIKTYEGE